jgi:hypothetical protein
MFDPQKTKLKMLDEVMEYASNGQAEELKSAYRQGPGPEVPEYAGADGAPVEKPTLDENGLPASEPELLLADLQDPAILKLLGGLLE